MESGDGRRINGINEATKKDTNHEDSFLHDIRFCLPPDSTHGQWVLEIEVFWILDLFC